MPKGACQGEGQRIINRAEADKIVEAILGCLKDEAYDGKTIGVIVLQGHAQAELIERKLAETVQPKVREDRKLRCGVPATFQGDQRDVIFLSLVIAPNHQFRSLTGLPDQRRFNVAMSRARDQVWLFHSVQQHDLSREDLRWRLLNFFYGQGQEALGSLHEELNRLEREAKRAVRRPGEQPHPYESWFEVDVALELLRQKYRVRPQYEVAGYRIDLVVEGIDARLAVECDGEAWHGAEQYEHDMARQRQLERAGWTFVRIRESEFYADRSLCVEQIIEECKRLGIYPVDHPETALPDTSAEHHEEAEAPQVDEADTNPQIDKAATTGYHDIDGEETADFGPFAGYSQESGFPDPREAPLAGVRAALLKIIERDGPLPRHSVYRLYVEGCPHLQRSGKTIRQILNQVLGHMLRAGEVVQEDEMGDGSPENLVIRLKDAPKVRERPRGRRELQDIPPSELFLVLDRIWASTAGPQPGDDRLSRALLDHYGFTRLTEPRRRYLLKILDVYRRRSFLPGRGGGHLLEDDPPGLKKHLPYD